VLFRLALARRRQLIACISDLDNRSRKRGDVIWFQLVSSNSRREYDLRLCAGSLEAINHRLNDGGITLYMSEVKGPIMDRLQRSHFLKELTGKVHLAQYNALSSINPDLACQTLEASRLEEPLRAAAGPQ
jgi:hypothetical protein